jgi:hypothetical protein
MTDETENSRLMATISELETRVAGLEERLGELTRQLKSPPDAVTGAGEQSITTQAQRLAKLEERHEKLLRYTPDAREEPDIFGYIWGTAIFIVVVYLLASGH